LTSSDYDEQWRRLYDFIKYNPGARHRRRLILRSIRGISTPRSVLDAGCGLGFTVRDLSTVIDASKITGLDFSSSAITWAKDRFPDSHWITGDLSTDLTTSLKEKFDLVVCTEVIEHMADHRSAIRTLSNLLNEGGSLLVTTQSGKIHETEISVGHLKHFSLDELEDLLTESGLLVTTSRAWGWPGMTFLKYSANINSSATVKRLGSGTYGWFARAFNHLAYVFSLSLSLPNSRWGPQLLVVAQKPTTGNR